MGQIINPGMASGGGFDENGTYPNLTVGNATHAVSADSATKATQDGNGNNIASTYAKKSELPDGDIYAIVMNDSAQLLTFIAPRTFTTITALKNWLIQKGCTSNQSCYPAVYSGQEKSVGMFVNQNQNGRLWVASGPIAGSALIGGEDEVSFFSVKIL